MTDSSFTSRIEAWLFRHRLGFLVLFLLLTVALFGFATQTKVDARFEKQLPLDHEYIETFRKYQDEFGGANRVIVALVVKEGDIFTTDYFEKLDALTKDVYALQGVDQASVTSLFTPNVRFTEVVEDGFTGGNVVPADYEMTPEGLAKVRENALKSNYMGRLVTDSFNGAMVMANLLDIDPGTKLPLDTFVVASELDQIKAIVKQEMESAASLTVPLTVDIETGPNWAEVE